MFKSRFKRRHQRASKFNNFKNWYKNNKKISIPLTLLVVILIGGGAFAYNQLKKEQPQILATPQKVKKKPAPPPKYYSELTGLEVSKEQSERPVTAIMIENSPSARPQSGIEKAGVVFEAIAEGGITRYLTLFQEAEPEIIGPVRSLRPYYVDWLAPFNASVAHVGGSANALDEVRNGSYRDIDQFFHADTYWRAADRYAPHNVYTSFEKINALNESLDYKTSEFEGFKRKKSAAPSKNPTATQISVDISGPLYNSSYDYNKESNGYSRFLAGEPDNNREDGKQIQPKVIIVMKTPYTQVFEDGYRESINTIGSGEAFIFQNGIVIEGSWHKKDKKNQLIFKDKNQKEIELTPGQTWLTAIPVEKNVTWSVQ